MVIMNTKSRSFCTLPAVNTNDGLEIVRLQIVCVFNGSYVDSAVCKSDELPSEQKITWNQLVVKEAKCRDHLLVNPKMGIIYLA